MLTVKIFNSLSKVMEIIEARSVRIVPITEGGKRIACEHLDGAGVTNYVINGRDFDMAYVENARGSTVQVVKP